MRFSGKGLPDSLIQVQRPMLRVCYALAPLVLASVYFFGWRSLVLLAVVVLFGSLTEAAFTLWQGRPVTSAVFVTCLIFHLSLPPTIPLWMAALGIIVGVGLGKMVFGGFGRNIFNPAMVGRCFIYITFPLQMTNRWVEPYPGFPAGLGRWFQPLDAITRATPLHGLAAGSGPDWTSLFLGQTAGSLGETSALLIILGGAYIIYKKAAPWRPALSCLLGGTLAGSILFWWGSGHIPDPWSALLAGSFLFGCFFVVTEPISGPKTKQGQWVYGFLIGGLVVVLRGFSNFSEGVMFAVLIMNAFVPLLDQLVRQGSALKASQS